MLPPESPEKLKKERLKLKEEDEREWRELVGEMPT